MSQPLLSKKKAFAISNGVFLIGLGILFYTNTWWPGILAVVWSSLIFRQGCTGRLYDFIISSIILLTLFFIALFNLKWDVLMPVLFVIGGIYIIFREYFFAEDTNGEDKAQEIKDDIDDERQSK